MNKKPYVKLLAALFAAMLMLSLGVVSAFADAPEVPDAEATVETDEVDASEDDAVGVTFTTERLPRMLGYMGVGMLCIVIVMGVLIAVTVILNKVTAPKDKSNS